MGDVYFTPAADEHIAREKDRARQLRGSQWWKRRIGEGRCHYCRGAVPPQDLTMDHVVPLVRGGFTKKSNVVPACKDCNTRKRDLLPVEWEEYLQRLGGDPSTRA